MESHPRIPMRSARTYAMRRDRITTEAQGGVEGMDNLVILLPQRGEIQRSQLNSLLCRAGFGVIALPNAKAIFRALQQKRGPDLLLVNASLETPRDGMEMVQLLHQKQYMVPIILLANNSTEELAITA